MWEPRDLGVAAICAALVLAANSSRCLCSYGLAHRWTIFPGSAIRSPRVLAAGDTLVVDQWYYAGGFAAGVAYYTGDFNFMSYQLAQLPHGASTVFVRTVTSVDPLRTRAAAAAPSDRRTWLITLANGKNALREAGLARSCRRASPQPSREFGDIHLIRLRCG